MHWMPISVKWNQQMKYLYNFKIVLYVFFYFSFHIAPVCVNGQSAALDNFEFNTGWKFFVGDQIGALSADFNDASWKTVNIPHDGTIEGMFDQKNPAGPDGGYLPTGICMYRKTFFVKAVNKTDDVFIDFDGVYRNSEVWINGHYLGKRPNGYISFRYELTPFLNFGDMENYIVVKVDNMAQPNSRWYTGTGIYRNVRLVISNKIHIDHWGIAITSQAVNERAAVADISTVVVNNSGITQQGIIKQTILDNTRRQVVSIQKSIQIGLKGQVIKQQLLVDAPHLWSVEAPYLYTIVTQLILKGKVLDEHHTNWGFRNFQFDSLKGFSLNGKNIKIKGVCNHHDLGCLGAAVNKSAIKRQLNILKAMGCNAIRTAHNPPATELLDLCDEMGFLVMEEAFDVWKVPKTKFDYHLDWDEWHKRDLEDQVRRDRNHPCVIIWSIGNEIPEQLNNNDIGSEIAIELRNIIRNIDSTRPITAGNNRPLKDNNIIRSGALDLIGVNYRHQLWDQFPSYYNGKVFIGTETVSGLQTRGVYKFPSDRQVRWGDPAHPVPPELFDYTCSAFDQMMASWGSTHEETLKLFNLHDFISGMFVWSGFDYLGEPYPYAWPARSSFYGIIDLAGFPKDVYYLYKSEWTRAPVLHLFPHWNWKENDLVDVWAYFNKADEVELYLNGISQGIKKKLDGALHVMWRIPFQPGTIKAVSRQQGKIVLTKEISTAGKEAHIVLTPDKSKINFKERELSFVTVSIRDANGTIVPLADNLLKFSVTGGAFIAGMDNGNPISHEMFKGNIRKAFNGLALVVLQPKDKLGKIVLTVSSEGLKPSSCTIVSY